MKAKLKAKILSVDKSGTMVALSIDTPIAGKVETRLMNAQDIFIGGTIRLKSVIADEMKIGAVLTISISDEETNEGTA